MFSKKQFLLSDFLWFIHQKPQQIGYVLNLRVYWFEDRHKFGEFFMLLGLSLHKKTF